MLTCNGIVKPVPKAADGCSWEMRKNQMGIPFITDGVKQRWCMSIFQEAAASSTQKVYESVDLPSLDVTADDINQSSGAGSVPHDSVPGRVELPGLTPASDIEDD